MLPTYYSTNSTIVMNFCSANLGSVISTDNIPEAEGHEAKNLLNSAECEGQKVSLFQGNNKGFLADYFVRPPVKLVVTFPCCIEISHVIIGPKVGRQVSNAFLIETEIVFNKSTKEETRSKHVVGKEFINKNPSPNKIIFRNPRFNLRKPYWKLPTLKEFYRNASSQDFTVGLKHPSNNALERVISLEITILRTEVSSIPSIGSLEIWGQPCVRCPTDQVQRLIDVYMKTEISTESSESSVHLRPQESNLDTGEESTRKRVKLFHERNSEKERMENVSIPEDFLDSLTYEMMIQPIRLPSGLAIDSSTLERYSAEEAIHGRLPNDPFSGLVFNDNLKPLADAALKSRIDLFLTQNANSREVKNLPRTLGSNPSIASSSASASTSNFSFISNSSTEVKIEHLCGCCKVLWNSKLIFFGGLCPHIKLCRNCMATQERYKKNNCSVCGIAWTVNDCKRIFL